MPLGTDEQSPRPSARDSDGRMLQSPAIYLPERSRHERQMAGLVFLLSFVYLLIFRRYTAMEPDEGIILQGAQRVLHNWDSTLLACLALYCAVSLLEHPNWKWAFAVGSFASLTFFFEQSKGAGLSLGLCGGFLVITLVGGRQHLLKRAQVIGLGLG